MSALLFRPIIIRNTDFKNRIAMSPMCMHSATHDGHIMLEIASALPNGPIGPGDLGIWKDSHFDSLARIEDAVYRFGAKAGAQLGNEK